MKPSRSRARGWAGVFPLIGCGAALVLAGCAAPPPPWIRPGAAGEQAAHDFASCKRLADRELLPRYGAADQGGSDPMRAAERDEGRRRHGALVAACMEERGYRRR